MKKKNAERECNNLGFFEEDKLYVEVAFNIPVNKTFIYLKPKEIEYSLVGIRVVAPFRGRGLKGVVVSECSNIKTTYRVLPLLKLIDNEPICAKQELDLALWMSNYYHCSFGEALFSALPAGIPAKIEKKAKPIKAKQKENFVLNDEQSFAIEKIKESLDKEINKNFLLHGVTGSGKTEVYIQAIKYATEKGKQAIVILPEIALTPQTIKRFAERFEGKVAVLHSKLSPNAKHRYWKMIQNNEIQIVIGARSAIFSPTPNLGIIVVDEEHETSYKSSDTPRYNARQLAFYRAGRENSTLILGSATPSVETYFYAKDEKQTIELLTLNKRASSINMPEINMIDMKTAKRSNIFNIMSEKLVEEINNTLSKKEQVILFLNRKGYSPYISCSHCGDVLICPNCSVSLTYHKKKDVVMCHYCGYTQSIASKCEKCNIGNLEKLGFGTEKVEENLKILFPDATIERVDQESVNTPKKYEEIFNCFQSGNIDILIGTQMIAKGLDFPNVTLVGVLMADSSINIPDFRSEERTFNLITQVAGRSGRGDKKGSVYIQTYKPEHFSLVSAKNHDYINFYNEEIKKRQAHSYPPYSRLIRLVVRGVDSKNVEADINKIYDLLVVKTYIHKDSLIILPPCPCIIEKIKKYYRWNIIIKAKSHSLLKDFFIEYENTFTASKGNYVEIDIDPINML